MTRLVLTRPHTHAGKSYGIGDRIEVDADAAEWLLANDIADARADLDRYLPWWRGLDPVRQRVLIDMSFNMGMGAPNRGGLLSFVNTLSNIRQGRYAEAADMMLASKWAQQVGRRAVRLATMMRTGMDYTE
jgi:lysozyme